MEPWDLALYSLASLLMLAAHTFRAARWALLFRAGEIDRRFDLLLGLALGYALNAVLPWRLGEIARTWFVSAQTGVRFSYVASTVVAERLCDLIVVSVIASAVLFNASHTAWPIPLVPIVLSMLLIGLSFQIQSSERTRRLIWTVASLFNNRLRFSIVDFFWSLGELVVGGALVKMRFVVATIGMWILYMLAYTSFATAAQQPLPDMLFAMLGSPLRPASEQLIFGDGAGALALLAFTGFPVLGILIYGAAKQLPPALKLLNARRRLGWHAGIGALRSTRKHFKAEGEYEYFLVSLFSGDNQAATSFGLNAIDDGTVHKLFAGGSDAITAMVEVDAHLLIRKFAMGASAAKLKGQHDWIKTYRCTTVPLVEVIGERQKSGSYHYDMPLVVPSNDFYDFIHTNPVAASKKIFGEVVGRISDFHRSHSGPTATPEMVHRYAAEKATANARKLLEFASTIFAGGSFTINGIRHDLERWKHLLDPEWLASQMRHRATTVVHGDLTIENIIVAPQQALGWYIIDPNPDNIFNSPLIDWAKLMQSVNLGYEGLNRNFSCTVGPDWVQLAFTKSMAYTDLHAQLEHLTRAHLGEDGLREVYFHELVHYLRLTPYKIRQDTRKAICFLACTCILLDRYMGQAL
jgi:hypothetical protein